MVNGKIIIVVFVVVWGLMSGAAWGATYYVDANGDDSSDGLSLANAFATIQKAANVVKPGDTVNIRAGTYTEGISISTGGTAAHYITFQPYNSEEVIIQPGTIHTGWTQDANGIYVKTITNFDSSATGQLIKKDYHAMTRVDSYNELLNPSTNADYVDSNDFDLFYYDANDGNVYLRLTSGGDPNTDVYVVPNMGIKILWDASYVEINGLDIQYAHTGIKSYSGNIKIIGCNISHTSYSGVYSDYDDLLIEDNHLSYISRLLYYSGGELILNPGRGTFYLRGDNLIIRNNITEKGGYLLLDQQSDSGNCEVYNNYLDAGVNGSGANLKMYNNIILNSRRDKNGDGRFGIRSTRGSYAQFYNNTIKALRGVEFSYTIDVNNYTFENNIICTDDPEAICINTQKLDLASSVLNHNVYYGGWKYVVGYLGNRNFWISFDDYQDDINDPNNGYNEQDSFYGDPCFINVFDFGEETVAHGSTTTFYVYDASLFEVNDVIEHNNDGVARTVTDVNTTTGMITINANDALGRNSLLGDLIYNWGPGVTDVNENFNLNANSLCIDAGDPNTDSDDVGTIDYEGYDRFIDGDGDGNLIVDIGANEMQPKVKNITQSILHFSIQDAIDNANDGDVIEVYEGSYYEEIDFAGKAVTVRSTDPNNWDMVGATIINNGDMSVPVIVFNSNEDANSVLRGFTITGGKKGVYCRGSSPVIGNCIIEGNKYYGVYCRNSSSPVIENNKIRDNGFGVRCKGGEAVIRNNLIYSNYYGIAILRNSSPIIRNNTIVDNYRYGIVGTRNVGTPNISNCILWNNNYDLGTKITNAKYSCIEDSFDVTNPNFEGSINSSPGFVDADNGDYHLDANSLCIDAGDLDGSYDGEYDIDGQTRVMMTEVDIGADEAAYFPSNHNDYDEWVLVGKPDCWCYPRQCRGDADGISEGEKSYWVGAMDLDVLTAAWYKPLGDISGNEICADSDHSPAGRKRWRVSTNDLNTLLANWQIENGPDPNCFDGY